VLIGGKHCSNHAKLPGAKATHHFLQVLLKALDYHQALQNKASHFISSQNPPSPEQKINPAGERTI